MFLGRISSKRYAFGGRTLLLLLSISGRLAADECPIDLPVYDPAGQMIPFTVTRVAPEHRSEMNLLESQPRLFDNTKGRLLLLDKTLLGRAVIVTLENAEHKTITNRIVLMQCPQRVSLRFGVAEGYGDLEFQRIQGRLTGCQFGDWWIRALPMFGASSPPAAIEGFIREDGTFSMSGAMSGERHIIVVGRGKEPIRAFGLNVNASRLNDAGSVDVSNGCRK